MARNLNQIIPGYVESDLRNGKTARAIRNRRKEISIYIYETQTDIIALEEADNAIKIDAKLNKSIMFNSTTPLNADISKPKFANPSESAVWGGQINGEIYEELDLNPDKYNFFTFEIVNQANVKAVKKYRIINNDPITDNTPKFIYATITALADTIKTIKAIEKINWQLVNVFQADVKTKYIKIESGPRSQIFPNGLKVSIKPEKELRVIQAQYNINSVGTSLAPNFIRVRQTDPYEYDNMTFNDPKTGSPSLWQDSNETKMYIGKVNEWGFLRPAAFKAQSRDSQSPAYITCYFNDIDIDRTENGQSTFFSKGLVVKDNGRTNVSVEQMNMTLSKVNDFMKGNFDIDGETLPNPGTSLNVVKEFSKLSDLDAKVETDREYFVLEKVKDLTKYLGIYYGEGNKGTGPQSEPRGGFFDTFKGIVQIGNEKTTLLRATETTLNQQTDDNVKIELELQTPGFNPKIEYDIVGEENIKITQYDADHKVIGTPDIVFSTEWQYNDATKKTIIQL